MKKNISHISGILVLIFIVISCSTEPVHITLLNPPGAQVETPDFTDYRPIEENLSSIRDIYFENITLSRSHGYAIYLCGRAEKYPTNINLKNIYAKAPLGLSGRFIDQVTLTGVRIENETGETFEWVDTKNVTIK